MLRYINGDVLKPIADGPKIICHCVNDIGKWGKGFVVQLSKVYPMAEQEYRAHYRAYSLGEVQFVKVSNDVVIANIFGQHNIYPDINGIPPIRYEALSQGFCRVTTEAKRIGATIHMVRIGCGLAGGDWPKVEQMVLKNIVNCGIDVYVYTKE
jgi:O-acetyl-ADP-ribose deacetylase (regulator of RNase III)